MKKLIAAATAVAMMMAMSVTAFAAGSPAQDQTTTTLEQFEQGAADAIVSEAQKNEGIKDELDKAGVDLSKKEDILGVYELTGGDKVVIGFGTKADGSREVYGIHQMANGTWEVVKGSRLENGDYEFQFNGNSPVIFALGNKVATTKTDASPKTGDNGAVAVIAAVAEAIA